MLDRWIFGAPSRTQQEPLQARLVAVAALVSLLAFLVDGTVHAVRGQLGAAFMSGLAVGLLGLLGVALRLTRASHLVAHGVFAVLVGYALAKIVASLGDTRAFYVLIFVPLMAIPICGLRGGVGWSLVAAAGSVAASLFPAMGWQPPVSVDAHLRPQDGFHVSAVLVMVSLAIAASFEVLRKRHAEDLRAARADTLHARAELDDSQERFRALLEHGFEGAAIVGLDGKLKYLRPGSEGRVLGYQRKDFAGRPLPQIVEEILHPEDRERVLTSLGEVFAIPGKLVVEVMRLRGRDGSFRTLEAAAHNLTREPAVRGLVINYRDLTDRADRERPAAEDGPRLPSEATLESLRLFAGGIAHEFNNMLTVILGQAGELAERLPPGGSDRVVVREIEDAGWRLASLTRNILIYSGRGNATLEPADLGRLVGDVFERARGAFPRAVELALHRPHRLIPVRVDSALASRAVRALLENAAEAMAAGGLVTLRVGTRNVDRETLADSMPTGGELEPGRLAFVSVSDEGRGISRADLPRVFDPYFSTHFAGRGLGLTLVLGIARAHGGAVRIETESGMGTTVTLLLPLADA